VPKDPRLPKKDLTAYTGYYDDVRLAITPADPRSTPVRRLGIVKEYPIVQGELHFYLSDIDALELVPSCPLYLILGSLVAGLDKWLAGGETTVHWFDDPWYIVVRGYPEEKQVSITMHAPPMDWVAMRDVRVPLDKFAEELFKVTEQWFEYLERFYALEIATDEPGQGFNVSKRILEDARRELHEYILSLP
jgi:hypothetical protein